MSFDQGKSVSDSNPLPTKVQADALPLPTGAATDIALVSLAALLGGFDSAGSALPTDFQIRTSVVAGNITILTGGGTVGGVATTYIKTITITGETTTYSKWVMQ